MPEPFIAVGSEYWLSCSDQTACEDLIEDKILSFANLEEGWNFGEGSPPSGEVIEKTIAIYRLGKRLGLDVEVFPVADGNIEISLYARDHFMDTFFHDDGRIEFSYEIGIGSKYRKVEHIGNITMNEVEERLCQLPKLCGASESLEIITIKGREDLYLGVSPTTKGGFRFLTESASRSVTLLPFANILKSFIVLTS